MAIDLKKVTDTSPFRKIAMGTWKVAKDPSVYGILEVDMGKVIEKLPAYIEKTGIKVTPAHLVGKAIAYCMTRRPEINGLIRGSRIYLRQEISLFYQVNIPGKASENGDKVANATLAGATVHHADKLSAAEIAKDLSERANKVRTGQDLEMKKNMDTFKLLPWWLSGYYLDFASFLIYGLNLDFSWLGIPKDPFGSVMITNVGGMGIDIALAPLCPYSRVPLLLAVGAVKDTPVVEDGNVVIKPIMPVGVTFDHRMIDGIHAASMAKDFKKCFAEPETYLLT
jgi:pyruvate/2-oxoglutarate dehydrogenase complex dihydrolipoamide acyltransferase (E2) component